MRQKSRKSQNIRQVVANGPESLPEGFKMTEIGPIPEHWKVVRLGEVAQVKYGKAKPEDEGTVPVVGSGGVYAYTKTALVEFPTLVIGRKGTAGQVWLCEQPCWPSDTTFYLEWKEPISLGFVFEFMRMNPPSGEHAKTTIPSLQRSDLESYLIPLPPLPEQQAIAHVLRTVQRAKGATERVIATLRDLKKSLMRHLFTYGPVPLDRVETVSMRETEIGLIPEHWRVVRLEEIVEKLQYGYTASAIDQPVGPKFLRITDIQSGKVLWSSVPFCAINENELEKYMLKTGDILVARIGATTGKTFLVTECPVAIFASYLIRIRILPNNVVPDFLWYFTNTQAYWEQINSSKGGRLKQGINIPVLQNLVVPLPPLTEQQQIAAILQAVDRRIQAEENFARALEGLFKTLLHDLMTARRRLPREFIARFEGPA